MSETTEALASKRSVLGRTFDILDCFADGHTEQSITALCDHTGLPPATVHRMLASLVEWDAIERAGRGRYRLGRRLWRLGSDVPSSRILKDVARPCLVDLHTMTGHIAALASADGKQVVVADVIAGRRALRAWSAPRHLPMTTSAPGLVLLAHLPLEDVRWHTGSATSTWGVTSSDFQLRQRFSEIRHLGVAVTTHRGMSWVSAPVFGEDGAVRSTICTVAPRDQVSLPAMSHVVRGAGRAVSAGLHQRAASAS